MNRIPFDEEEDGPELVPPAELVRLRNLLMRGPRAAVRARHLAVATAEARQRPLVARTAGRLATWGGRVAVGIVASLAITSGLAGAQLLPQPAQRLLSGVSDRFAPPETVPSTTIVESAPVVAAQGGSSPSADRRARTVPGGVADSTDAADEVATTSPSTTEVPLVVTTIPGPGSPGSPTDPTTGSGEPEPSTTTTTEPEPTTTTTTSRSPSPSTTTTTISSR